MAGMLIFRILSAQFVASETANFSRFQRTFSVVSLDAETAESFSELSADYSTDGEFVGTTLAGLAPNPPNGLRATYRLFRSALKDGSGP